MNTIAPIIIITHRVQKKNTMKSNVFSITDKAEFILVEISKNLDLECFYTIDRQKYGYFGHVNLYITELDKKKFGF